MNSNEKFSNYLIEPSNSDVKNSILNIWYNLTSSVSVLKFDTSR